MQNNAVIQPDPIVCKADQILAEISILDNPYFNGSS